MDNKSVLFEENFIYTQDFENNQLAKVNKMDRRFNNGYYESSLNVKASSAESINNTRSNEVLMGTDNFYFFKQDFKWQINTNGRQNIEGFLHYMLQSGNLIDRQPSFQNNSICNDALSEASDDEYENDSEDIKKFEMQRSIQRLRDQIGQLRSEVEREKQLCDEQEESMRKYLKAWESRADLTQSRDLEKRRKGGKIIAVGSSDVPNVKSIYSTPFTKLSDQTETESLDFVKRDTEITDEALLKNYQFTRTLNDRPIGDYICGNSLEKPFIINSDFAAYLSEKGKQI